MKKVILKKVAIILGTVIILLGITSVLFIGKMVNDGVLYQNKENDTKNNSIVQLEEWGFDRDAFHNSYEGTDFSVESKDGNTVPGTIYFSKENQPWVILVHGAGGDREFVISYAQMYLEMNYNVLTFDERGHGDNSDERVTFGIRESHDVEALVDYIKTEYGAEDIVLHGQSMGGATAALYAATEHGNANLSACILDCPVAGMELFLTEMFMEDDCSKGTAEAIVNCGKVYSGIFGHLNYKDGDTIEKAKNIQVPTTVIVSKQDTVCPAEDVMKVYESITAPKELVEFDCEHIRGIVDYQQDYYQAVSEFLNDKIK